MNKRKHNDAERGGGSLSNNQDSVGTEIRSSQFQMEEETINTDPNSNTNQIKAQTFNETNLPCFFNLAPAEAKLKELNASQNAKYRMFAFDCDAEGAKMFVVGQLEDFTAICFHRKTSNKFNGYNYEVLMDGQSMKLFCNCEYLEADNPEKDKDSVLCALLYYICKAYQQVPKPNNWSATLVTEDLLVETCHRDGKVSYHVKIPENFGVVTSMEVQKAFWRRVTTLAHDDLNSNEEEHRQRADDLRVLRDLKGKLFEDWVVDFAVYHDHSQCFRNLKAAKHPKQNQFTRSQDYLVPLGKSLQDITEDEWKESLIMNVSSDAMTLQVPKEWCNARDDKNLLSDAELTSQHAMMESFYIQGIDAEDAPTNPCPRLLQHIKTVLLSNNQDHYEYLLNRLSWIVQRYGKSTLVNVLQKISGPRCLQIINWQHLLTPLSPDDIYNEVLMVLNESTWNEGEVHEGQLKASMTGNDSLSQEFGEIKSTKCSWNLMFVTNDIWCYPADEFNRRFFCPTVSNEHVEDHQYFNELLDELENGGVEEFLHFLMNRQLPSNWTPAQCLPK